MKKIDQEAWICRERKEERELPDPHLCECEEASKLPEDLDGPLVQLPRQPGTCIYHVLKEHPEAVGLNQPVCVDFECGADISTLGGTRIVPVWRYACGGPPSCLFTLPLSSFHT